MDEIEEIYSWDYSRLIKFYDITVNTIDIRLSEAMSSQSFINPNRAQIRQLMILCKLVRERVDFEHYDLGIVDDHTLSVFFEITVKYSEVLFDVIEFYNLK